MLDERVRFRLLGSLEVVEGDRVLPLGGLRRQALLALLLLHRNQAVSLDVIVDALWGERPPKTAIQVVRVYVSQLRKALEHARPEAEPQLLVTAGRGYALHVDRRLVDADRFEDLRTEGKRFLGEGNPEAAADTLHKALALWRGPPLPEFAYESFAQAEIVRLSELHLTTLEDFAEAALAAGRDAELVADLEHLVAVHPLRERLRAQLMLALYRSGRQAEALEVYQRGRRVLVDELGIEPGETLVRLEARILQQDQTLARAARASAPLVAAKRAGRPLRYLALAGGPVAALGLVVGIVLALSTGNAQRPAQADRIAYVSPGPPPRPGVEIPVITDPINGIRAAAHELGASASLYWNGSYAVAARNSGLVIVGATSDLDRVAAVIRSHPATRFVVGEPVTGKDSPFAGEPNVTGLVYDDRELGLVAGYLAGLMAKPRGIVSAVGGIPTTSVTNLISGYENGVRRAGRGVRVLVRYSGTFDRQSRCERIADAQIDRGSTVVFDVAGGCGFGALQAAGIRRVWGIGVDNDVSYLGPQILASAVKHLDRTAGLAVTLFANGSLPARRDVHLNLATDSVGLVGISDRVPASVREKVEALASRLRARDQALRH